MIFLLFIYFWRKTFSTIKVIKQTEAALIKEFWRVRSWIVSCAHSFQNTLHFPFPLHNHLWVRQKKTLQTEPCDWLHAGGRVRRVKLYWLQQSSCSSKWMWRRHRHTEPNFHCGRHIRISFNRPALLAPHKAIDSQSWRYVVGMVTPALDRVKLTVRLHKWNHAFRAAAPIVFLTKTTQHSDITSLSVCPSAAFTNICNRRGMIVQTLKPPWPWAQISVCDLLGRRWRLSPGISKVPPYFSVGQKSL